MNQDRNVHDTERPEGARALQQALRGNRGDAVHRSTQSADSHRDPLAAAYRDGIHRGQEDIFAELSAIANAWDRAGLSSLASAMRYAVAHTGKRLHARR